MILKRKRREVRNKKMVKIKALRNLLSYETKQRLRSFQKDKKMDLVIRKEAKKELDKRKKK